MSMAVIDTYTGSAPTGDKRCDRCGAQAWVIATMSYGGELGFCCHHYKQHEVAVVAQAVSIKDHRPYLNAREEAARKKSGV